VKKQNRQKYKFSDMKPKNDLSKSRYHAQIVAECLDPL